MQKLFLDSTVLKSTLGSSGRGRASYGTVLRRFPPHLLLLSSLLTSGNTVTVLINSLNPQQIAVVSPPPRANEVT